MDIDLYKAELEHIRALSDAITHQREALRLLEEARATLLRRYTAAGVPRPLMTEASGLTRGRMWQIVQPDVTQEARRYAKSMSEADEEILDQALEQWEAAGKDEPIGFYLASVREKSYAE